MAERREAAAGRPTVAPPLVDPELVSMRADGLDDVRALFEAQLADGLHPGAVLAVYRYGRLVLDLRGGTADERDGRPVVEDTMFVLYSCGKAFAAACIFILKDRGLLDWDDPISRHWPRFGRHGKDGVTVRHLLSHTGGFPDMPESLPPEDWGDWDAVVRAMEEAPLTYPPGSVMAYHIAQFGWVIAELVRRLDGRTFDRFFAEELAAPLGLIDTYVGLPPALEDRVARLHLMEEGADPYGFVPLLNRPDMHQVINPAGNAIGTARDLARFWAMIERGGELEGTRVISSETIAEAVVKQVEGVDATVGYFTRRSLGFAVGEERMGSIADDPLRTVGHGGAGTSVGWADLDDGLAFAYITNGFWANPVNDPRLAAMADAVRAARR